MKIVNFVGRRFVCLMVLSGLLFLAPNRSVKANAPTLSTYARFDFHPYWDGLTSGQLQPYTAAYMTTDYLSGSPEWGAAFAFKVTVSLAGTNRAVIQADNVLAAGIAAQGPHKVKPPWIDWGYLLLLVVDGVESEPYIQGAVWKGYEWGRNALFPYETPVADLVSQWTWRYPGVLTINSDVTLEMAWNNSTETLNYSATIGGIRYDLYSYVPEPEQSCYFMTGTIGREWLYPLPGIVKALQFVGAWSYYSIETGWRSHLSAPAFVRSNETTWRSVSFAYAVDGRYAFMDNSMVWGGNVYESANAHYPLEPYGIGFGHVIFYPHPYGYVIPTDTLLWDPTTDCSSGGNGCPYVYAWDGQRFVKDNNLLAAAEVSNGADVEDYYKLEQQLAPTYQGVYFSTYSLQIREYEHEHDHFDMAKLLRVDRPPDVNVAVSPYGEILTYANPMAPTSAVDDFGNDVLSSLSTVGGDYYEGYNGSYVTVKFNATNVADGVKLVIREDGPFSPPVPKCPVDIQVQNASSHWNTVAVFHTRTYWATDIINMTGSLPDANGEFKVRLCFIANDLIDYIGLDATPQAPIEVEEATLLLAVHSSQGFVTPLLRANDQNYAELIPGQQIQLAFMLPTKQNQESTFILLSEGHYSAEQ